MSAIARKSLFHPEWLAIVLTLAVAWMLYRPVDVASIPARERTQPISDLPPGSGDHCVSECLEGSCDGTYEIAASEVHLLPVPPAMNASDESSIYGNVAHAEDPFQVSEPVPIASVVIPIQYVEPIEASLAERESIDPAQHIQCECPSRLPSTMDGPTLVQSNEVSVEPRQTVSAAVPRMCALTDRRSGVPVATLKIAAEIRAEALDLATYQHTPCKSQQFVESEDQEFSSKWETNEVPLREPDFVADRGADHAQAGHVDGVDDGACAEPSIDGSRYAVYQTIEQSQSWIQSGHVDEAVDLLANALFDNPRDVHLLQHMAIAYLAKHDTASALSAAEQCLVIDRANADSNEVMSHVLGALGQVNRARHYADHALFLRRNADAAAPRRP